MPRYIDADELLKKVKYRAEYESLCDFEFVTPTDIDETSTADVVPKSEIMRLVGACYDKCEECRRGLTIEVAREMFEEIERGIAELYPILYAPTLNKFGAELKKKYTGGE